MAGFTVPIVYQEIGKDQALASLARVNRATQQMAAGLSALGGLAGKTANSFQKMGRSTELAIKNQNAFSRMQREFKALALEAARYDAALAQTNSTLRMHLHAVNAPIAAYERQQKALLSSRAALAAFNIEKFKETLANKLSLENAKRDAVAKDAQARAQAKASASLALMNTAEGRQLAVSQMATQLMRQKNALLAAQDPMIKRLTADIALMSAAQTKAAVAQHHFNLRLALGNQATSAMRAAIYGLGTSFGIYTSSTILAASATFAFFAGLRATFKTGIEFEAQLARLGALISTAGQGTQEYAADLDKLKGRALEIAGSTRFMASEVLEAMEKLGLAGFTVDQTIAGVKDVLNLAAIGALDFGEAADIASNVLMGFGLQMEDLGHVVDVISRAATESNLNVQEMGHSMSYAAPVAKSFGVSLEFTAAMMEVLANAGIKGSRAGTGVRRMLISLFTPNERAQKAMKQFGITVNEVASEMSDLEGLERPITGLFKGAEYGTEALIKKLKEFYIATAGATNNLELLRESVGVYALPAFTQLIASLDRGEKSLFAVAEGLDSVAGSADEALAKIQDNLQTTLLLIKSAAEATALKIYDSEKGGLKDLAEEVMLVVRTVSQSDATINAFIAAIKSLGEAIWGVIKLILIFKGVILIFKGVMLLVGVISATVHGIQMLASAFTALAGAMSVFKGLAIASTFGLLAGQAALLFGVLRGAALLVFTPMGLAITAVVGGLVYLISKFVDLKKVFSGFSDTFGAYDQAAETQRLNNQARYNGLASGQLEALHEQRDTLEQQLKLQKAQTGEAVKLRSELAGVSQQLNAAYEDMRRYAEVNLSVDILKAQKTIADLEQVIRDLEPRKVKTNRVYTGAGGMVGMRSVDRGVSAQIDKETAKLAVQRAELAKIESIQKSILGASKEQQRFALTGGLSENKRTLEMLEKLFKKTRDEYLAFLRLSNQAEADKTLEYLGVLQAHILTLTGNIQELENQANALGRGSAVTLGETLAFIGTALKGVDETRNYLAMPEADRLAEDLKKAETAAANLKRQLDFLMLGLAGIAAAEKQSKEGSAEAIALATARNRVASEADALIAQYIEALNKQNEAEKAHASSVGASEKAQGGLADAYGKTLKSAYDLKEAELELAQAQIDQQQSWTSANEALLKRSDIYAKVTAQARELKKSLVEERLTAPELTGRPSPIGSRGAAGSAGSNWATDTVVKIAMEVGVDPRLAIAVWDQESNKGTDLNLKHQIIKTGKNAGSYGQGPWGKMSFHGPIEPDFESATRWALTHLKERGVRGYYGTGKAPAGHPTTDEYESEVLGKAGLSKRDLQEQTLAFKEQAQQLVVLKQAREGSVTATEAQVAAAQKELDWATRLDAVRKEQIATEGKLGAALAEVEHFRDLERGGMQLDLAQSKAKESALQRYTELLGKANSERDLAIYAEEKLTRQGRITRIEIERATEEIEALSSSYGTVVSEQENFNLAQAQMATLVELNKMSLYEYNTRMDEFRQRLADAQGPIAGFYESLNYGAVDFKNAFVDAMGTLRDSIAEALETGKMSFKDFFDSIKSFIYRFLADKAIQLFLAPFAGALGLTVSASNAIAGAAGGQQTAGLTGTGATGTGGGFGLSGIGNWFGGNSMGLTLGRGLAYGAGSLGMSGNWIGSSVSNLAMTPNWALGAGALGGGLLGSALFGDKGYGAIGSSIGSAAGSAIGAALIGQALIPIPGVGAIIGGVLGGVGGGWLGSLFGGGEEKKPVAWIDEQQGVFKGVKGQSLTDEQADQFQAMVGEVNRFLDELTALLGPGAAAARAGQTRQSPQALSPEQVGPWLEGVVKQMIGTDLLPNMGDSLFAELAKEAWEATGGDMAAFAQQVASLKQMADALPQIVEQLTTAGLVLGEDAERTAVELLKLAGSVDALFSAQQSLDQLFLSQEEMQIKQGEALKTAFGEMNLVLPDTREALQQLVGGLDLTTEEGRRAYLSIAAMADALGGYYDAAQAAADATREAAAALEELKATALEGLRELFYSEEEYAKYQKDQAQSDMTRILQEAGIDISLISDWTEAGIRTFIEAYKGGMAGFVDVLGEAAGDFLKAIQQYFAAIRTLEQATPAPTTATYTQDSSGTIRDSNGNPVFVYGNPNPYVDSRTGQIVSGGPLGGPSQFELDQAATQAKRELLLTMKEWVAETRKANEALKETVNLEQARYAYYVALNKAQNGIYAGLTDAADKYLEMAKLQAGSALEYYRMVARVTGQVEAIALAGLQTRRTQPSLTQGFLPMFASGGIATGPSTGYPAILHGDEAVIPLENGSVPINLSYGDLIAEIKALRYDVNAGSVRQIELNKKTADTLTKWDDDGLPPERT